MNPWWNDPDREEYVCMLDLALWAFKSWRVDSHDIFRFEQLWALREDLA